MICMMRQHSQVACHAKTVFHRYSLRSGVGKDSHVHTVIGSLPMHTKQGLKGLVAVCMLPFDATSCRPCLARVLLNGCPKCPEALIDTVSLDSLTVVLRKLSHDFPKGLALVVHYVSTPVCGSSFTCVSPSTLMIIPPSPARTRRGARYSGQRLHN
jgi:hypothetical protein